MMSSHAKNAEFEVNTSLTRDKKPYADFYSTTQMETVKLSYMWTIKDFKSLILKKVDAVFTNYFWAENTPHVVRQLVLKIGSEKQENLELELKHIQKQCVPYKLSIKAHISILNAESERKHAAVTFEGNSKENDKFSENNLIAKSLLMEQSDDLLPNNSLTLFCEISQSGFFTLQETDNFPTFQDSMPDDFSKLFENPLFTDAIIDVSGTLFKVHKAVIAARSPVFWEMFNPEKSTQEQERSITEIRDVEPKVFREILRYMYTGKIENVREIAFKLFVAADKYDLEDLKIISENAIYDDVNVVNAMDILVVADKLQINQLKQKVFKFIESNLEAVMAQERWGEVINSNKELATEIMRMLITD